MRFYSEQEVDSLLSDFGNYLLSDKRAETIKRKENISEVHMEDVLNWGGLQARPTSAADLVFSERVAHFEREGWTDRADDTYLNNELAYGAVAYALPNISEELFTRGRIGDNDVASEVAINVFVKRSIFWKFAEGFWKPTPNGNDGRIKELVKAGSLILAEIDRLLRLRTPKDAKCYTEDKVYRVIKAKKSHSNYGGIREIGTVKDFLIPAGTPTIFPDGWLLCNGGLLEKEQFPELFAVIGDKFCYKDDMDDPDKFRLPILTTDSQNKA